MPFPESPRVIFRNNPIAQVIAQLRFPPILAISAAEPASFQERIRADYPLYSREGALPREVPAEIAPIVRQLSGAVGSAIHLFSNEDKSRSIVLAPEHVALDAKSYARWEQFADALGKAREALTSVYNPPF